jgi:hypothetical protein
MNRQQANEHRQKTERDDQRRSLIIPERKSGFVVVTYPFCHATVSAF